MLTNMFLAVAFTLLLLLGWVSVQQLARLFAARYPQFGPAREEGGGCGTSCGCHGGGHCKRQPE